MRERIEDYLEKYSSTSLTVLIAQAQSEKIPFISGDDRLAKYDVEIIW